MTARTFRLFSDFHQFYLQDEAATGDLGDAWTDDAVARHIATEPGILGVGTVRVSEVPVEVEVRDVPPADDFTNWDRVNEATLDVPSGRVVVAGCTDYFPDAARIIVSPGTYRARVYYGGLGTVSEDGLEGADHYRVVLWPAPPAPVAQLKTCAT
jgi:hypothetical protein